MACEAHVVIYKCAAFFLGRRAPSDCTVLLEALQKPLIDAYCEGSNTTRDVDMAREGYLFALSSGIMFLPVNPIDKSIWLRMEDFRGGLAVKAVHDECNMRFYALGTSEAARSALSPVFGVIMSRNKGVILNDCYGFSLADDAAATNLQLAVESAFSNRAGWTGNSKPPKITYLDLDRKFFKEKKQEEEQGPLDRFKRPPLGGFFYASAPNLVKCYNIKNKADAPPPPPEPAPAPCPAPEPAPAPPVVQERVAEAPKGHMIDLDNTVFVLLEEEPVPEEEPEPEQAPEPEPVPVQRAPALGTTGMSEWMKSTVMNKATVRNKGVAVLQDQQGNAKELPQFEMRCGAEEGGGGQMPPPPAYSFPADGYAFLAEEQPLQNPPQQQQQAEPTFQPYTQPAPMYYAPIQTATNPAPQLQTATDSKPAAAQEFLLVDPKTGEPVQIADPSSFDFAAYGIDPTDPSIMIMRSDMFKPEPVESAAY